MKANRATRMNESAVSPVIGSILMVAIVVVLAGTVWFVVGLVRDDVNVDAYPQIRFVANDAQDTVSVTSFKGWTGPTLYWSNVSGDDSYVVVSGCDDVNGNDLDGTIEVQVGDVFHCSPGTVAVTYPPVNQLIYTTELN